MHVMGGRRSRNLTPPFSRPPAGAPVAHASGVTAEWGGCNGWLGVAQRLAPTRCRHGDPSADLATPSRTAAPRAPYAASPTGKPFWARRVMRQPLLAR